MATPQLRVFVKSQTKIIQPGPGKVKIMEMASKNYTSFSFSALATASVAEAT